MGSEGQQPQCPSFSSPKNSSPSSMCLDGSLSDKGCGLSLGELCEIMDELGKPADREHFEKYGPTTCPQECNSEAVLCPGST